MILREYPDGAPGAQQRPRQPAIPGRKNGQAFRNGVGVLQMHQTAGYGVDVRVRALELKTMEGGIDKEAVAEGDERRGTAWVKERQREPPTYTK